MEQTITVAVWVGTASSWPELDASLEFGYTEDGDSIPSPFAAAFGIDWFDEDFREADVVDDKTCDIQALLDGHSEGSKIADAVETAGVTVEPSNATVILCEWPYSGFVTVAEFQGIRLRFLGNFEIIREPYLNPKL